MSELCSRSRRLSRLTGGRGRGGGGGWEGRGELGKGEGKRGGERRGGIAGEEVEKTEIVAAVILIIID